MDIDPYLLENKKIYLRYSYDDILQLYINGKLLVSADHAAANLKGELPDSILNTMKLLLQLIVRIKKVVH